MNVEPVVIQENDLGWEGWPEDQVVERGKVFWKTLLSGDRTPSDCLTLGLCEVPPGEALHVHRHAQAEAYYVLEGEGVVTLDGHEHAVKKGSALFIPGNAHHGIRNPSGAPLRFIYTFPANSFEEIVYIF